MQKTAGSSFSKLYEFVTALLGWFALIAQFILLIENRTTSLSETIIRFFSFFTILTNILVALGFSFLLLNGNSKWRRFFSSVSSQTAMTVYIIVVGAVYNIVSGHKPETALSGLIVSLISIAVMSAERKPVDR